MEKKVSTADDAFMEFIKTEFNNTLEKEKDIRRKMIIDDCTITRKVRKVIVLKRFIRIILYAIFCNAFIMTT